MAYHVRSAKSGKPRKVSQCAWRRATPIITSKQWYGCDSPDHQHGTLANTAKERADCYAYQMGRQMIRIVEEVTRRCPGVIVDFDITEGGRFVGLGFLAVGKYFLINNGPYFHDFDIPRTVTIEPDTIN